MSSEDNKEIKIKKREKKRNRRKKKRKSERYHGKDKDIRVKEIFVRFDPDCIPLKSRLFQ